MRRSSAPSQTQSPQVLPKRSKFHVPFKKVTSGITNLANNEVDIDFNIRSVEFDGKEETTFSRENISLLETGSLDNIIDRNLGLECSESDPTNKQLGVDYEIVRETFNNRENVQPEEGVFQCSDLKSDSECRSDMLEPNNTLIQAQQPGISNNKRKSIQKFKAKLNTGITLTPKSDYSVVILKTGDSESNIIHQHHPRYFKVTWCKLSSRKHKRWEGDAILEVKLRTASILNMGGKVIAKGTGYKQSELATLLVGETLKVSGKECEIVNPVSDDDFKSGRCFRAQWQPEVQEQSTYSPKSFSSFKIPQISKESLESSVKSKSEIAPSLSIKPRHDPTVSDAIVMRHPNDTGPNNIVDVVIDPYISYHLRRHQQDGVRFLYDCVMGFMEHGCHGCILADSMGLGKTLQTIALIWTLLKQGPHGRPVIRKALIATPSSLVANWQREFGKWLGEERIKVFTVNQNQRVDEFIRSPIYPVLILSYDMVIRCVRDLSKIKFDLLVCDEGHRLKNNSIKLTSTLSSLGISRRIVLTGTPIQNNLVEFHSLLDFCNPNILGSLASFRKLYEEPIVCSHQGIATAEEKILGAERMADLNRLTEKMVLRRTEEVNREYLPSKIECVIFCHLTSMQLSLYHSLLRTLVRNSFIDSSDCGFHLAGIGALRKLCNHPKLIFESTIDSEHIEDLDGIYVGLKKHFPSEYKPKVEDSGKCVVLAKLLSGIHLKKQKVVLVSSFTQTLNVMEDICVNEDYKCLRLDGQTTSNKRNDIVRLFNSKSSHFTVMLLSTKAGGVGLNLTGASHLILYDVDWNPANDIQAMARIWRDGQSGAVYIYRLLSTGTIEEKMYQRQLTKQKLNTAVFEYEGGGGRRGAGFSREELKELFQYTKTADCETHDLLQCDCDGTGYQGASLGSGELVKDSVNSLSQWEHYRCMSLCNYPESWVSVCRDLGISYVVRQISNSEGDSSTN